MGYICKSLVKIKNKANKSVRNGQKAQARNYAVVFTTK